MCPPVLLRALPFGAHIAINGAIVTGKEVVRE
jgi:hypothetical protein